MAAATIATEEKLTMKVTMKMEWEGIGSAVHISNITNYYGAF